MGTSVDAFVGRFVELSLGVLERLKTGKIQPSWVLSVGALVALSWGHSWVHSCRGSNFAFAWSVRPSPRQVLAILAQRTRPVSGGLGQFRHLLAIWMRTNHKLALPAHLQLKTRQRG